MNNTKDAIPPFGAAPGSGTLECCSEWTRSAWRLDVLVVRRDGAMYRTPDSFLRFCPWCGHARPNEKLSNADLTRDELAHLIDMISVPGMGQYHSKTDSWTYPVVIQRKLIVMLSNEKVSD